MVFSKNGHFWTNAYACWRPQKKPKKWKMSKKISPVPRNFSWKRFFGKTLPKKLFLGILVLKLTEFFFWKNTTKKIFFGNFSVKIDRIFFLGIFKAKKKIPVLEKCPQVSLLLLYKRLLKLLCGTLRTLRTQKSRYWRFFGYRENVRKSFLRTLFSTNLGTGKKGPGRDRHFCFFFLE